MTHGQLHPNFRHLLLGILLVGVAVGSCSRRAWSAPASRVTAAATRPAPALANAPLSAAGAGAAPPRIDGAVRWRLPERAVWITADGNLALIAGSEAAFSVEVGSGRVLYRVAPSMFQGGIFPRTHHLVGELLIRPDAARLAAVDLHTGATRWTLPSGREGIARPDAVQVVRGGGLVVLADADEYRGIGRATLLAVDQNSGARRWQRRLDEPAATALASDGDRLYVETLRSAAAFALQSGEPLWQVPRTADYSIHGGIVSHGGRVAFQDRPDSVVIRSGDRDQVLARTAALDGPAFTLLLDDSTLAISVVQYLANDQQQLVVSSADARTGATRWRRVYSAHPSLGYFATLIDGRIFFHTGDGMLRSLDAITGMASVPWGFAQISSVALASGIAGDPLLLVATRDPAQSPDRGAVVAVPAALWPTPDEVVVQGRAAAALDARVCTRGQLRVQVGDEVVAVAANGRYTARIRARGILAVRVDADSVLSRCTNPRSAAKEGKFVCAHAEPAYLQLDGRAGPYSADVKLRQYLCQDP